MGWLKKALFGAIAAKTAQNVYNQPIVTAPSGLVVRGLKQKGIGANWVVKYSKTNQMNVTSEFTISQATRSFSVGADTFIVDWP